MGVDPVPGEAAAVVDVGESEPALVVADYHAGLEAGLRRRGVELPDRAEARRDRLLSLLDRTGAGRVVVLGDLANAIGEPGAEEREELTTLLSALADRATVTVTKGNHDGRLESVVEAAGLDATVTPGHGTRIGDVGFAHGHTWPSPAVVEAPTVCVAHEHPAVRLADEVGGSRVERAWLRGRLDPAPFEAHHGREFDGGTLVVFPAFNERVGGTWVNVESEFLSPFLPAGLADGEAYLLDGVRLGDYRRV